ncbi:MAG: hypothetical protein IJ037_02345 [Clostridia bacterium]|nr:hypothetical protein [Clostridia bacterium]
MKAIVISKPYDIEIRDIPVPEVKNGDAHGSDSPGMGLSPEDSAKLLTGSENKDA